MRFTTVRLCGGKSFMAISSDEMDLNMEEAAKKLETMGITITHRDDMMLVFTWNGMETTLYPQGKIMFFPLEDKHLCIKYAMKILKSLE